MDSRSPSSKDHSHFSAGAANPEPRKIDPLVALAALSFACWLFASHSVARAAETVASALRLLAG